uniref:serine/threonine-protein kinase Chk1 isoform X1 n=2 Tax=Myxine glutinosa TaxID=7769 RepID=UPI00358E6BD1
MRMAVPIPFVEGWDLVQTLGEGAYGEVRLAVNRTTDEAVAVKIIEIDRAAAGAGQAVRKEVCVQRMLNHMNVVRCYGHRKDGPTQYIFLEYCSGGELFDRIEPDVGMPERDAMMFFRQLLAGVEYLHGMGIAHRDIKPENLLLDANDFLKISDFGLATVFRASGRERSINRMCGTLPYIAPEVISKKECRAEPVDIWACGIVLVAMLAGELPWDEPSKNCQEYNDWLSKKCHITPWSKIHPLPLALLTKILEVNPENRATKSIIKKDLWLTKVGQIGSRSSRQVSPICSTFKRHRSASNSLNSDDASRWASSQPEPRLSPNSSTEMSVVALDALLRGYSFSQPLQPDHMLLGSQLQHTQGSSQSPWLRMVKRMTRFWVTTDPDCALQRLRLSCEEMCMTIRPACQNQVTVSTLDRRGNKLIFKVTLLCMDAKVLLDFRLSRGDGLEFKRCFLKIKNDLCDIISKVVATPGLP